jgi:hypothetical protein
VSGFVAEGPDAEAYLKTIPIGTVMKVEVRKPRSGLHHRKYWALCGLVAQNHATLETARQVDQAIKMLSGHVDLVRVQDEVFRIPASISFAAMDQDQFAEFYNRACDVVVRELLPGVSLREVQDEVLRMCS